MNKLYIAHMKSNGLSSKLVTFFSSFNKNYSRKNTSSRHTALIYENDKKDRFIIEADVIKGVYTIDFNEYMKNVKVESELVIHYTKLDILSSGDDNFSEFVNFLETNYVGSLYSAKKALKSFEFEGLNGEDILEITKKIDERKNNENSNRFFTFISNFLKSTFGKFLFKSSSDALRDLRNKYGHKTIDDVTKKISDLGVSLNVKEINLLKDLSKLESLNKDPNKKFFYCTELVLTIIRDWCSKKNIQLPDFMQDENVIKQKLYEIYPQELFDIIKKKNSKYILKTLV